MHTAPTHPRPWACPDGIGPGAPCQWPIGWQLHLLLSLSFACVWQLFTCEKGKMVWAGERDLVAFLFGGARVYATMLYAMLYDIPKAHPPTTNSAKSSRYTQWQQGTTSLMSRRVQVPHARSLTHLAGFTAAIFLILATTSTKKALAILTRAPPIRFPECGTATWGGIKSESFVDVITTAGTCLPCPINEVPDDSGTLDCFEM
jgi:hypothetical protein